MQALSSDTTKILTEKLALAREIAVLRPEVESLRAQVETNKALLSEKLALQRQLTTVQVELENAQRSAQRTAVKAGKNPDQTELDLQIGELQMKLREAKLARREAEGEVEQLKSDLEAEKRASSRNKSKKTKNDEAMTNIEEELQSLKQDLTSAKQEASRWQKEAKRLEQDRTAHPESSETSKPEDDEALLRLKAQLDSVRKELTTEKRERQKAEKALIKEQAAWEAQKSLLDEKLNQFRIKLRSTKERLKEAEEQLEAVQAAPKQVAVSKKTEKPTKGQGRKRTAAQLDAATIGTPGDEPAAKRGKRAGSVVHALPGDKSTFSITPFLNRTSISIAPETPQDNETQDKPEDPKIPEPQDDTPIKAVPAIKKPTAPPGLQIKPLTAASSSKHNARRSRKMSSLPSLQEVAEESSEINSGKSKYEEQTRTETIPLAGDPEKKDQQQPVPKLKATSLKPRKSLMTFTSYTEEPAPEKRKKRKLGASGVPKTLFDEEDDAPPPKPIPGRGLFAARALGKSLGAKKSGGANSSLLVADNGFQFSPLKKERRAGSTTFLEQ
jgi:hypothetical protein